MKNLLFRPQDLSKKWTIKRRLKGINETYNFVDRAVFAWQPVGWRINKKTIARQHSKYTTLHATHPGLFVKSGRKLMMRSIRSTLVQNMQVCDI